MNGDNAPRIARPTWGLVLGGAEGMADDVAALETLLHAPWPGIVVAANNAAADWPWRLDHVVTWHPEKLWAPDPADGTGNWLGIRKERGYPGSYKIWGRRAPEIVDEVIAPWGGGASGHLGLRVLAHLGCERAVLCGIPMDSTPHYHDDHDGENWRHADLHWKSWLRYRHKIDGWVRSMSGRTAETLGRPDRAWLLEK